MKENEINKRSIINKAISISQNYNDFKNNLMKFNIDIKDKENDIEFYDLENGKVLNFNDKKLTKNLITLLIQNNLKLFEKSEMYKQYNYVNLIEKKVHKDVLISKDYNEFKNYLRNENIIVNDDRDYLRFKIDNISEKFIRARIDNKYFYKNEIIDLIIKTNNEEYAKEFNKEFINYQNSDTYKNYMKLKVEFKKLYSESCEIKKELNYKEIWHTLKDKIGYVIDSNEEKFIKKRELRHWGAKHNLQVNLNAINSLNNKYNTNSVFDIENISNNKKDQIQNYYKINRSLVDEKNILYKSLKKLENKVGNEAIYDKTNIQIKLNDIQKQLNINNKKINELKYDIKELDLLEKTISKFRNINISKEIDKKYAEKNRKEKSNLEKYKNNRENIR